MKEEIWSILQYKDMAEKKADNRPEIVCTMCIFNISEKGVEIRATHEFNEYFDSSYLKKDIQP